jgi:cytochrome c oxidase assembly protein subunit 15
MNLNLLGIAHLVLTVLLVASLPLSIVLASRDANKYRKLAWVTLFLTFDLVVFGGFTRLTDSGLGCPDWPGCYGHANPLQANTEIQSAQAIMPTGPVTERKAWIEMIHRYLASAVGVLILAMICISCWKRVWDKDKSRIFHPAWPFGLLALIVVQGGFGALTVTMKLQPVIVTTHLLLGLTLLGALGWNYARLDDIAPVSPRAYGLRHLALVALLFLAFQTALGGWVSTNYATLACGEFPLCQGQLVPPMDFANGFTLWRALGRTANGAYLSLDALTAIHWVHRNFALIAIAAVGYVAWQARKIAGMERLGKRLLAVLAVQFITGVSTIFFQFPLLLAVLHNAGAALLVALLVMVNYRSRNAPRQAGPA